MLERSGRQTKITSSDVLSHTGVYLHVAHPQDIHKCLVSNHSVLRGSTDVPERYVQSKSDNAMSHKDKLEENLYIKKGGGKQLLAHFGNKANHLKGCVNVKVSQYSGKILNHSSFIYR